MIFEQFLNSLKLRTIVMAFCLPMAAQSVASPPSPPQYCMTGPYIVFFDLGSKKISENGVIVVAEVVKSAKAGCAGANINVEGHTDTSRKEASKSKLSQERAQEVANMLITAGLPLASIKMSSYGSERLNIKTRQGVEEVQNRRVVITFSAGG